MNETQRLMSRCHDPIYCGQTQFYLLGSNVIGLATTPPLMRPTVRVSLRAVPAEVQRQRQEVSLPTCDFLFRHSRGGHRISLAITSMLSCWTLPFS